MSRLRYGLSVLGAGGIDVNQHPRAASLSGATLTLTLSRAARPGEETVTLFYDGTLLRDLDGNRTPPFRELAVTNKTPGGAAPAPVRGSAVGRTLRLVFDRALETGPPHRRGTASRSSVAAGRELARSRPRATGAATASGKTLTVRLIEGLDKADRYRVIYTRPGDRAPSYVGLPEGGRKPAPRRRLRPPRSGVVPLLDRDGARRRRTPRLLGGEVSGTRVALWFDEELDESSTPAAGDFAVTVAGARCDDLVRRRRGQQRSADAERRGRRRIASRGVLHGRGEPGPGRGPANPLAAFRRTLTAAGSGKPTLQSATVESARLALTYDLPLDPGSVPAPGAFHPAHVAGPGRYGL